MNKTKKAKNENARKVLQEEELGRRASGGSSDSTTDTFDQVCQR